MVIDLNFDVDIRKGVMPQHVTQPLYYDDQNAHRIIASLYRGQQQIDLTGLSCNGYVTFVKDGASIGPLVGEVSGNTCSIVLPHEAYYYPGAIRIELKLIEGEEVTTVLMLTGQVAGGRGDRVIDIDGAVVPSIDALGELANKMQDLYDEITDMGIESLVTDVSYLKTGLAAFLTPEMFGAAGDGVTDDTAAFQSLAAENATIVIGNKSYVIDQPVTLSGRVISDSGTYPNYEPQYAHEIDIRINDLCYGEDIELPEPKSYSEALSHIGNRHYVIVKNYSVSGHNCTNIVVYDDSFTLIQSVACSESYGIANSCTTDGTYLYVDFHTGYHVKYSPADLTTPVLAVSNNTYRNVCCYNHQLFAVNLTSTTITVGKLSSDLNTVTDTWSVATTYSEPQAAFIFKGHLYLPTTIGEFRIVDIVSHEIKAIRYELIKEIEGLYEFNGELMVVGHWHGFDGVFNVGRFDGGYDADILTYIKVDGSIGAPVDFGVQYGDRSNLYHVTNGLQKGLPLDTCDVIVLDSAIICASYQENAVYRRNATTWTYWGPMYSSVNYFNPASGVIVRYKLLPGNVASVFVRAYGRTDQSKDYTVDFSDLFAKLGLGNNDNIDRKCIGETKDYLATSANGDVYIVEVRIYKNKLNLSARNLTNPGIYNFTVENTFTFYYNN